MSNPPPRMRADARRNRDRILEIARASFTANGIGASLDDIATRAGVGPGTLYRHFPSREALVGAALSGSFGDLHVLAARLAEVDDSRAAIREWMTALVRHYGTFTGLPASLAHALRDPDSALYSSCMGVKRGSERILERAIAAGVARPDLTAGDLVLIAVALAGSVEGGDSSVEVQRLIELVLTGLTPG